MLFFQFEHFCARRSVRKLGYCIEILCEPGLLGFVGRWLPAFTNEKVLW